MAKPVIIEARLNEWSLRQKNPHVPWSPREIAEDAYACWKAGAAIVHFHVRNGDGSPAHDVGLYAEAIRLIRERCDVLIHPTMAGVVTPDAATRIAPLARLCEDEATRPDFAPLDMGSTNLDQFDAARGDFTTQAKTYVNTVGTLKQLAGEVQRLGLKELMCIWTVPCLRTVDTFVQAGWVRDDPALLCLVLTEGGILGGHPGTVDGLDSLLRFLPQRRLEWSVCCREGNLVDVAAAAIERGGHVSTGIGDYAYAELGCPTNAQLVQLTAEQALAGRRRAATVAETRALLGMTP
ncbi:3-keto-5-aminohexanoate cleavage protein [Ramlibacter albus]|uniref:3-keto-5-aminohexanoate cleavage protein n=1 Tax=Ramlibacter albus TaxID=2079448 RepID=A0A923M978_9BURK|nr:3-keto-5-aminohexanoate cleavage protein [Ramlibacter albus]MBC5765700.1 3-keto-5-aminohexanoate cleavage protein [Ramlibacter albus]